MAQHVRRVRRKRRTRSRNGGWRLAPARAAVLAASILVGLAIGLVCLKYGPRAYTAWRETRMLRRASEMLQRQNYDEAIRAAREVLQVRNDSLPAFYILAEATEKQNRPDTVAWRSQIARLLPGEVDSQLNLASAALRFGQLDIASKALDRVAPKDRDKAAYHVVAGWLARAQGNDAGVEEHFAAAARQEPANDLYQFNLAAMQIRSADEQKHDAARDTLERLSQVVGFRTAALRALLNEAVRENDLQRAESLAQDLQMSQQVTFGDYLLCLDLYRKLDEKRFASLLEKVKPVAIRNRGDVGPLMDWMNRNGLGAEVIKWMEKLQTDIATTPPAAIAIAEAFSEAKNWSRLKRWTRSGSWGDADFLRLAYQANAARQSRQSAADAEFDSLWRSAERATGEIPERELQLARLATKWNLDAEAERLWLHVTKYAPARREALDVLFKLYRGNNDLPNLYKTAQRLYESSPNEPGIAANYARLALLLDQNTKEGQRVAKEAYDRAPMDVNCAVTYAFSLYGLGRTVEGIQIIKALPAEYLHDAHAAAYVAVLLLDDNQIEAADEYLKAARKGPIYLEEKKLLDEAVAKSASAATPAVPEGTPGISPSPAQSVAPTPPFTSHSR